MKAVPNGKQATTRSGVLARATMATVLMVAAIAALAITSLIQSHERAAAQSSVVIQPAPSMATMPTSVPLDSGEVGRFAFGFLVFDWDPADGVPGFNSWPPASPPRP